MIFDFPDRVNVERGIKTEDAYGTSQTRSWSVVHRNLPCRLTPVSGSEARQYQTTQPALSHIMSCGWIQIKASGRITYRARVLQVLAVIEKRAVRGAGMSLKVLLEEIEGRGE